MPLKTNILAAQINNLSDARYFSTYPVEWLSFTCNSDSKNYVDVEKMKEILGWIAGPKVVLDVRGCDQKQIEGLLSEVETTAVIVEAEQAIATNSTEIFRFFTIGENVEELNTTINNAQKTDLFILDFLTNKIANNVLYSDGIKTLVTKKPCLILANITANEVEDFLALNTKGLVILGGEEEKVGIRSFDDIQDLMEELDEWE